MKLLSRLRYPFIILVIIGLSIWLAHIQHTLVEQLKAQGKDYNVGIATVTPEKGQDGESAYEIAVRRGYKGTEEEWLSSLVGFAARGDDGYSAYEVAVRNGFRGTETEWLASLRGQDGQSIQGQNGANGITPPCYFEESQCRGPAGASGANGANGQDGKPPTSWTFTYNEAEYLCRQTEPFDYANPTYTCNPVNQPESIEEQ